MNYYQYGIATLQGSPIVYSTQVGQLPFLPTPGVAEIVRDKLAQINQEMNALGSDIRTNVQRPQFLQAWNEFKQNWDAFYNEHYPSTLRLYLTGLGTVDRRADDYKRQLQAWYDAVKTENPQARLVFPAPTPPVAKTEPLPWYVTSLLTVGGAALAAYLGYSAYQYLTKRGRRNETTRIVRESGFVRRPTTGSMTRVLQRRRGEIASDAQRQFKPIYFNFDVDSDSDLDVDNDHEYDE